MIDDDTTRLARKAGFETVDIVANHWAELHRFADLVRADERDRICKEIAKLHDALSLTSSSNRV